MPTESPTSVASPTTATIDATATPTIPARLAPDVLQAAAGFRAAAAALGQPSSQQLAAAQDALSHAVALFAASGAVGNVALEQQFAAALKPTVGAGPRFDVAVLSADLDGDGTRELLVSARVAGLLPFLVPGGQPTPQPLAVGGTGPTRGLLTTIDRVLGLSGNRSGILVTQVSQGASATNTRIQVVAWDGARQAIVFDQGISDWAGPARWDVTSDRQIQLTCPAFGVYDHKLLPHPLQVRRYRWDGSAPSPGAFVLSSRHTDPPASPRELINLAEADFFAGDWSRAAQRYQMAIQGPALPADPGDQVDWPDLARLRLGEIALLTDRPAEAATWLGPASRAAAPLGGVASALLGAAGRGAPAGFAAVQQSNLPALFDQGTTGNLDFPIALRPFAALGQGVAYRLDHLPEAANLTPDQLRADLTALGLQTGDAVAGDLDGDGTRELAIVLPFGKHVQTLWLFVERGGRWQPIATLEASSGLDGLQASSGGRQAIRVRNQPGASAPVTLLGWDGRQVGVASPDSLGLVPIPTGYVPAGDCAVAEDA